MSKRFGRNQRRPTEAAARAAIEAWLDEYAPGYPGYSICEDGDEDSAEGKCGWAFWVTDEDRTSYVHEDLSIEWYGTDWPEDCPCLWCRNKRREGAKVAGIFLPVEAFTMIVCETCGNKRCPHSDDHRNRCTGSNETGQPGSRYRK